tara:strand:- start:11 stop:613 length:603 start_codon:yes stop_codon:yes gene_type:complete
MQYLIPILKSLFPYLVCFIAGLLLAWQGCGDGAAKTITQTIEVEKPVYVTEYVDRWKTDTVRFVDTRIVNIHDTITNEIIYIDTVFDIDTISIVENWLTEVNKYDTLISFDDVSVSLNWQNYQNRSENLFVTHAFKQPRKSSFGAHVMIGATGNFDPDARPFLGIGLYGEVRRTHIGATYGYNLNEHFVGLTIGRTLLPR